MTSIRKSSINQYVNQTNSNIKASKQQTPSAEEKNMISKLKIREKEVIAHEQAHKSVGGQFSGAMNYSYTTGPDGRRYVSGGEVSISIPGGESSEKLIQDLRQVKRAALAPANPSGQDMSVASSAQSKIQKISAQLNKRILKEYKKNTKFDDNKKSTLDILV